MMRLDILGGVNTKQRPKDGKIWCIFGPRVFPLARVSDGEEKERDKFLTVEWDQIV